MNQPALEVKNLSVTFSNNNGGLNVLDNLNFNIEMREFVCFLGASGSGKTTLLKILAGLHQATTGTVLIDGESVNGPKDGVGIVFQNANLMPWRTVEENIFLPLELKEEKYREKFRGLVNEVIDLVGLNGFENSLPRDLSGGMAQRVAIARALIYDPEILLLDEPFGALDAITREKMGEELLRIWNVKQKTVLMVTHDITESIYLSDRVIVLSERPAKIQLDIKVDLPRPRNYSLRYTPEFGRLANILRNSIS